MSFQLPDPSTPFGERVARRLREELIIWLTTIDLKGTPQPNPVWFLWDEATSSFLVYNRPYAKRLAHIQHNSRVSLNLDGNGRGGDIIVFTGEARLTTGELPPNEQTLYLEKYRARIAAIGSTPERFAAGYPVTLRVYPSVVRGN